MADTSASVKQTLNSHNTASDHNTVNNHDNEGSSTMHSYAYRAINPTTGQIHNGEQSGESAYAVRSALRRIGLQVIEMRHIAAADAQRGWLMNHINHALWSRLRRQRRNQRADLYDALATMIDAGLPLEQALANVSRAASRGKKERRMLQHLRDRVREGMQLSDVCAMHQSWFDDIDIAIIHAAQHAGELPDGLRSLGSFLQQRGEVSQQFLAALMYPAILALAALGVTLFLSVKTLPQLMSMLTDAGLEAPTLTIMVASCGQTVWHYWWAILMVFIAVLSIGNYILRRIATDSKIGQFLHSNVLTRAVHRARIAQVAGTLARLQRSGIPLADALDVVSASAPSRALQSLLQHCAQDIRAGKDFSEAIRHSHLLDDEFAQLLELGEESGELPNMLERIAERYQRAAERSIQTLSALLEPIAVLILAVLIGTIAMAAVLPLMEMTKIL